MPDPATARGRRGRRVARLTAIGGACLLVTGLLGCGFVPEAASPATTGLVLRLEYAVRAAAGEAPRPDDVHIVADVMRRRLDTTGLVSPSVIVNPDGRIVIELAIGIRSSGESRALADDIRALLGPTGRIELIPISAGTPPTPGDVIDPATRAVLVSGDSIETASRSVDESGNSTLFLTLRPVGIEALARHTRGHIGEFLAIVEDGRVLAAPAILEPIENGAIAISLPGSAASSLLARLQAGVYPFPVEEVASATLR